MQFQLLLLNNLNQHISLFILKHLHFGTASENDAVAVIHQILPQGKPTAWPGSQGDKYKGTIMSSHEKVRTSLISFQIFFT